MGCLELVDAGCWYILLECAISGCVFWLASRDVCAMLIGGGLIVAKRINVGTMQTL